MNLAASLNEQGVERLLTGDISRASAAFDKACCLLDQINATPGPTNQAIPCSLSLEKVFVTANMSNSFLYTHALIFSNSAQQWTESDRVLVRGLIDYNRALLLQLQDSGDGTKSRCAFPLYRQALRAIRAAPTGFQGTADAVVVAIGCLNNMSQIYVDFDRMDKAKALMASAKHLLDSLAAAEHASLDAASFQLFFANQHFLSVSSGLIRGAPCA